MIAVELIFTNNSEAPIENIKMGDTVSSVVKFLGWRLKFLYYKCWNEIKEYDIGSFVDTANGFESP